MNFTSRHLLVYTFVLSILIVYLVAFHRQSIMVFTSPSGKPNKNLTAQQQNPKYKTEQKSQNPPDNSALTDEDFPPSEGDTYKGISRKTQRTLRHVKLDEKSPPALIENTYHALLYNNDGTCEKNYHFGNPLDGSYRICNDPPYQVKIGDCIVYSFGINHMWTFDDIIVEKLKCKVFAFDPTMRVKEQMRGPNIHFYPIGLGGNDTDKFMGNLKLMTLKNIIKMLGHENKNIDILKVDIEYSEWVSFERAIQDDALKNVVQLVFESHTVLGQTKEVIQRYNTLHKLHEIGFRQWGFRDNIVTPTKRSPFTGKYLICCVDHFFIKKRN